MIKFGTSGLRGPAQDLTDALVAAYATAFLERMGGERVLVGRDLRASSPRIAEAVARGAARAGCAVLDCGVLPTPALALASSDQDAPAIMVTGSHIPADRNGLKFYRPGGEEIAKADEDWLVPAAEALAAVALPDNPDTTALDAMEPFRTRYTGFFAPDALSGLRIGVYEHSSAAREVLPRLLADLGATPVPLGRAAQFVAVDTEAIGGETRGMLAGWAAEHGLDAIVSTDGDADRPMLADAAGDVIPGDRLGPITARLLGAQHVVTTVSANTLVDRMGLSVERTRIGSPYVIAAMERAIAEGRQVAGYEPNGGFLLGFEARRDGRSLAPLMTRDFALPILATLVAARESGQDVAALSAALPSRFTATDRLTDVAPETSAAVVAELGDGRRDAIPQDLGQIRDVETTDGMRLTFDGGEILHIRPSGNAPELRCYVEADTPGRAGTLLAEALDRLKDRVSKTGGNGPE